MYYSYVMGIDNRVMELASQGFDIQNDGDNYCSYSSWWKRISSH